ncbi:MAG TPA: hypothetical protein VGK73_34775 [Polyangiaceae bacterium]
MRPFAVLLLGVLLFVLARDTRRAEACGGPYVWSPSVAAAPELLEWNYDAPRAEVAFLYPFRSVYPEEAEISWKFAYEGLAAVPPPDARALEAALAANDRERARKEARALVERWYALPPVLAAPHRPVLLRALAVLEPSGATSPSRKFFDLVDDFRRRVPNGWSAGTRAAVPAALWVEQHAAARSWLRANPGHPLRDLVELWQVRIHFFEGKHEAAYRILFRLFPRRRVRALAELRYLVQQNLWPAAADLDALGDPLLLAPFVDDASATPERWSRWWALSEKASNRAGVALQERLLRVVTHRPPGAELPAGFPAHAAKPSNYWGKLRAVALQQRGRWREAAEQLALLDADEEQASLLAKSYVELGDPLRAARLPALNGVNVSYLVQVLAPRRELAALTSDPDPLLRGEAQSAVAADLLRSGDVAGAARALRVPQPERASALERIAKLRRSGDELELARAWRELGSGDDPGVYRGFSMLYPRFAPGSAEAKNIVSYLEASSGSFQSLAPYVAWLEKHPGARNARAVLAEADAAYIALTAYGGWPNLFWVQYLERHDLVARLRRVGKRIRSAHGGASGLSK